MVGNGVTVTGTLNDVAHCPAVGVKTYVPSVVLLIVAGIQVPLIPLFETAGSVGAVVPEQKVIVKLNVGVTFGVIVTGTLKGVAHCPVVGVNTYVPPVVLFIVAGIQVPVIPLTETPGSVGAVDPEQSVVAKLNVGVTFGVTVTGTLNGEAHCPAVGVNTYVPPVVLLIVAGIHVPLIPLSETAGRVGAVAAEQNVVVKLNAGVTFGVTVTGTLKGVAHCPAVGVNTYVPPVVLIIVAGIHVPPIPLSETAGSAGAVAPEQNVVAKLNVGVAFGVTVIGTLNGEAHCPTVGVNTYVPPVVLFIVAGIHVPPIPLSETAGSVGAVAPEQNVVAKLKVGVMDGLTMTLMVAVVAHCPASGVKV